MWSSATASMTSSWFELGRRNPRHLSPRPNAWPIQRLTRTAACTCQWISWMASRLESSTCPVNLVDGKPVDLNNRAILPERGHIGFEVDLFRAVSARVSVSCHPCSMSDGGGCGEKRRPDAISRARRLTPRHGSQARHEEAGRAPGAPSGASKAQAESGAKPVTASNRAPTSTVSKDAGAVADAAVGDTRAAMTASEDKADGTRLTQNRLQAESGAKPVTASNRALTSTVSKDAGAVADAAVGDTRAAMTASAGKADGTRLTQNRLGAPVARKALERAGGKEFADVAAKTAAKSARRRALLEFAGKGLRLTAKVGRVAFVILDLANPIFDILLAVQLVDALVGWLRRDKIREHEEWLRLNDFLVGERMRTVTPYGINLLDVDPSDRERLYRAQAGGGFVRPELPLLARAVEQEAEDIQRIPCTPRSTSTWSGQEASTAGPYSVKYYADAPHISFSDAPQPNKRVVTSSIGLVGPQDKRNRSTEGAEARYDPDFNISVDISFQSVRYTPPQPTLTPFDFLIVKCRHLVAEIVAFMSRYDPAIIDGMDIRTEIIDPGHVFRGEKMYWLEGETFAAPLQSAEIHFCLKTVFWVIDTLEANALREGDYHRKDRADQFNAGYYRRLAILRLVTSARGDLKGSERYAVRPLYDVAGHLQMIVSRSDKAAVEDIEYLMDLAVRIDDDLRQTLKECQSSSSSLEYNYEGKTLT